MVHAVVPESDPVIRVMCCLFSALRPASWPFLHESPKRYIPRFKNALPAEEMRQHYFEFIDDIDLACSRKALILKVHMWRLMSSVMAPVAIVYDLRCI
jgi:hypothetical protein